MTVTNDLNALQGNAKNSVPVGGGLPTRLWAADVRVVNSDGTVDVQPVNSRNSKVKVPVVATYFNPTVGDRVLVSELNGEQQYPVVLAPLAAAHQIAAPPRARNNASSGLPSLPATTTTQISLSSGWTLANGMINSGGGLKVPLTGHYAFTAQVVGGNPTPPPYFQAWFEVNGGSSMEAVVMGVPTAAVLPTLTLVDELSLNANDVVTLWCYNAASSAFTPYSVLWFARYTGQ